MNELIDIQRQQVDTFNEGAKRLGEDWKREVLALVDMKLKKEKEKAENEKYCQSLKDQAFRV